MCVCALARSQLQSDGRVGQRRPRRRMSRRVAVVMSSVDTDAAAASECAAICAREFTLLLCRLGEWRKFAAAAAAVAAMVERV